MDNITLISGSYLSVPMLKHHSESGKPMCGCGDSEVYDTALSILAAILPPAQAPVDAQISEEFDYGGGETEMEEDELDAIESKRLELCNHPLRPIQLNSGASVPKLAWELHHDFAHAHLLKCNPDVEQRFERDDIQNWIEGQHDYDLLPE